MPENSKWKTNILVIGGIAGLLTGLAAAFLFIRSREQSETDMKISSGHGVQIGMSVVSLLKTIVSGGTK
jgi:hypothetical protein